MAAVYPDAGDVRYDVQYGPNGNDYTGTLVGTVDSTGAYQAVGIIDSGGDYYGYGVLDGNGVYQLSGILDSGGNYYAYGILDADGHPHALGVLSPAGQYFDMDHALRSADGNFYSENLSDGVIAAGISWGLNDAGLGTLVEGGRIIGG